jgi:hypothetical protein
VSKLAAKKAARTICGSAIARAENFFIVKPLCSAIVHGRLHKNQFRFRNFQPRAEFSISMCLRAIAISAMRHAELFAAQPRASAPALL